MNSLHGIKVIDLTQFLSASYCAQILGDLGAEVIKIEKPGTGEVYRNYGPKFIHGESTSFLSVNRNKKSLSLNLKKQKGIDIVKKLVKKSDVFIENFKPGTLKKYHLDYKSVKLLNPKLIYCSVSGYGSSGPYANKGGFDLVAQGMSGIMAVTGDENGPPAKVGYAVTDIGSGMYAAIGILAAIIAKEKTGEGQFVDTSLFETGVAWGIMSVLNYFADGSIPKRMGSASPQNAPYQAFETKDGAFTVGTGNEVLWKKFCEIFNLSHLVNDSEYSTNALRVKNQKSLSFKIQKSIKNLRTKDCINLLEDAGIPCGPINTLDQVINDPQIIARNLIIEMNHRKAGKIKTLAFPVKLSSTPANIRLAPPLLGEHTIEILNELGYRNEEIVQLENEKVIEIYQGERNNK